MEIVLPVAGTMPILTVGAPSLRQPSREVSFQSEEEQIKRWAQQLGRALWDHPTGIGLAAPQVGWNIRVVAMELSGRKSPVQVWVNPVIKRRIGLRTSREGCLSIPEQYYDCRRSKRVEIVAFTPEGVRHAWKCDGLEAICWQHEVDHLDGKLIEDEDLRPTPQNA